MLDQGIKVYLISGLYYKTTIITNLAWAKLLQYTLLEKIARDKHFRVFGPYLSYEENEVLWIQLSRCLRYKTFTAIYASNK